MYQALSEKVLVLGIDGMDPMITRKFLAKGALPNVQKLISRGAQRDDLVMLGGVPTVTPPMWTTLATGATPATHGITCFWNHDHNNFEKLVFALNSKLCKAEQLWNVTAESGIKTLVWHWPGSSWPPSIDHENLHVVAGTNPGSINQDAANVDWEKIFLGSSAYAEVGVDGHTAAKGGAGCVVSDLDALVDSARDESFKNMLAGKTGDILVMDQNDSEISQLSRVLPDMYRLPIKEAQGWAEAPVGAKESAILTSDTLVRRPILILANEQGIYDRIAIYKSKKETKPMAVIAKGEYFEDYFDIVVKQDGTTYQTNRSVKLVDLADNGDSFTLWMSFALDVDQDKLFHPKFLYQDILKNVGHVQPISIMSSVNARLFKEIVMTSWEHYLKWAAEALNYMIKSGEYKAVFSHMHNIDGMAHQFWHFAKPQKYWSYEPGTEKLYQEYMQIVYEQADQYVGAFMHLLDEDWTIILVSDHGLISEENEPPIIGEMTGINIEVMEELGFTVTKKDENGKPLREIDWSKTKAIASRGDHIWINLKGRNETGIVEPDEKYELERQIIDALYNYRDPLTGKRVISIALRNKDAALIGMNGPECGDIIYFMDEGFNRIHADSLPTQEGYYDTSVSPIFIAAGKGLKQNYRTNRVIRITDIAPTVAALLGVRIPRECEGAPVYQILDV